MVCPEWHSNGSRSVRWTVGLCFIDQSLLKGTGLIFEDGHSCCHSPETKMAIKGLFAWNGVKQDFLVTGGQCNELGDDFFS